MMHSKSQTPDPAVSQQAKPGTSSDSEMLTPSEIASLKQKAKEQIALAEAELERLKAASRKRGASD